MKEKTFLAGVMLSCAGGIATAVLLLLAVANAQVPPLFTALPAAVSLAALFATLWRAFDRFNAIAPEATPVTLADDNGDRLRHPFID